MISHVIHPAEHTSTSLPLADNTRVVPRLMTSTVFLTRETAMSGLRTSLISTKEVFLMTVEMLPQITASFE
jgi:hypothetical protein